MLELLWKLLKIWGGKGLELLFKLLKAQLRAMVWRYGVMVFMIIFTSLLAFLVLR